MGGKKTVRRQKEEEGEGDEGNGSGHARSLGHRAVSGEAEEADIAASLTLQPRR